MRRCASRRRSRGLAWRTWPSTSAMTRWTSHVKSARATKRPARRCVTWQRGAWEPGPPHQLQEQALEPCGPTAVGEQGVQAGHPRPPPVPQGCKPATEEGQRREAGAEGTVDGVLEQPGDPPSPARSTMVRAALVQRNPPGSTITSSGGRWLVDRTTACGLVHPLRDAERAARRALQRSCRSRAAQRRSGRRQRRSNRDRAGRLAATSATSLARPAMAKVRGPTRRSWPRPSARRIIDSVHPAARSCSRRHDAVLSGCDLRDLRPPLHARDVCLTAPRSEAAARTEARNPLRRERIP